MKNFLLILIIFVSHFIQGITGFAGTLLAMPWSSKVIGFESARSMMNLLTIFSALLIVIMNFRYIHKRELAKITLFMGFGLVFGILVKNTAQLDILMILYGLIILGVAVQGIISFYCNRAKEDVVYDSSNEVQLTSKKYLAIDVIILFLAGVIHGIYVSGGALMVLYAVKHIKDKKKFRATVAALWIILNTAIALTDLFSGKFIMDNIRYVGITILPCLIATQIGIVVQKYISNSVFTIITYGLLLLTGGSIIF
ncbi:MAG: sulfite exporter TauE/SafE family protein [Spirochaetales bacterium]|nr:sulfite exporter TauE/SafE family protein [Spirochaetales bacterium]